MSPSDVPHNSLLDFFQRLTDTAVLVAGDIMLDRYWFSEVERISPEAPVPIARIGRCEERLGGSANVACNITRLQARTGLVTVIGGDEAGKKAMQLLDHHGIEPYVVCDDRLTTTVKLRIIARNQQLMRLDFENTPSYEVLATKLKDYAKALPQYKLVILSDYGKGGLRHIGKMIDMANQNHIPVIIDPKGDDYQRYRGATLMTPNTNELQMVVGKWRDEADLEIRAQNLRRDLQHQALLLTRSEEGMTLFTEEHVFSIPTQTREVYDVSGAGDTVIAVFGLALSCGYNFIDAMKIANHAAGIVVSKFGTASVTQEELRQSLQNTGTF